MQVCDRVSGARDEELRKVSIPALVMHGTDDPGHWPRVVDAISALSERSERLD